MDFQARKLAVLQALASTLPDKSLKGNVDEPIASLIDRINSHPAFFTTSSCSGRISISVSNLSPDQEDEEQIVVDENEDNSKNNNNNNNNKKKKKKKGGEWSFITHYQADAVSVIEAVSKSCQQREYGTMVFRFEPFILAVECKDLVAGQALVSCAISSGFRESGITSASKRIIAAVRCSIRIETPIAEGGQLLVSHDYLRYLVSLANAKMISNHERTQRFMDCFINQVENNLFDTGLKPGIEHLPTGEKYTTKARAKFKDDKNRQQRKLSELEKRQQRIISRLDAIEKKMCGIQVSVHKTKSILRNELARTQLSENKIDNQLCEKGRCYDLLSVSSEKVFRWGHSTCTLENSHGHPSTTLLIFGGYGGSSRQGRRNDLVMVSHTNGRAESICAENPPSPRMGHTASLIERKMIVIGGREDPSKPLGDVCVFNLDKMSWIYPQVGGAFFPPRHRHAAVSIGEKIYVFGGLGDDVVYGDMFILDTATMQWSQIECKGQLPSPRHSHSLSVVDRKIYLFGGYDGLTVFGDFFVLDVLNLTWTPIKLDLMPRFSHSMTPCAGFLVLIGGCPLNKHANMITLVSIGSMKCIPLRIDLPPECLLVRHTASNVGNQIVVLGGGVTCYAFGVRFSPPFLIDVTKLSANQSCKTSDLGSGAVTDNTKENEANSGNFCWGLKICKTHTKKLKDYLKQQGWLDRSQKASDEGQYIVLPITTEAAHRLKIVKKNHVQDLNDHIGDFPEHAQDFDIVLLKLQKSCKRVRDPKQILHENILCLLQKHSMPQSLLNEVPTRWERLDDMAVLPEDSFRSESWSVLGQELWDMIAKSLNVNRVSRQARVKANNTRDSNLVLLLGNNGWVHHKENGILYCFDATRCMYSSGNVSEKLRMAKLDCSNEIVVDLFAGIGYFVLPFLLKAKAKLLYACEWNPPALDALKYNLQVNSVQDRCIILEGDNRITAPRGAADRVCLGLLPTSELSWGVAVKALRPAGGILHIHANVKDDEEQKWVDYVCASIKSLSEGEGYHWDVSAVHLERVKWYAPRIRHLVVDVMGKQKVMVSSGSL